MLVVSYGILIAGYPVRSVPWLKDNRKCGDILAHFDISSFILNQLGLQFKVAVDGRYEEVYPQATFDLANLALWPDSPGHTDAVRAIAPDFIILGEPGNSLDVTKNPRRMGADSQ